MNRYVYVVNNWGTRDLTGIVVKNGYRDPSSNTG